MIQWKNRILNENGGHFKWPLSVRDSKVIQISFKAILGCQNGISQITILMSPFLQAAVIEQFEIVFDYKGYNSVSQAFFKKSQAAYSAVVILEGMNAFKAYMKIQQIPQFFF